MKKFLNHCSIIAFLFPLISFGFNFSVSATNETCSGNGSLSFNVSNTNSAGSILYIIYKLPNTITPLSTSTSTTIIGLVAGDYRVIARETVGTTATEQQQDATILNSVVPLTFSVQSLNQACTDTSTITVNTLTGTSVSYEIFSGPLLFPLQSSNTFSGLTVGVYRIRVFDNCGVGVATTFTVTQNNTGITIGQPQLAQVTPPNCNLISVTNTLTPATGTIIGYPIAITYTIFPPSGGAPTVVNSTLNSGNPTSQNLEQIMTNYINQSFSYSLSITDVCGTTFTSNFVVNNQVKISHTITNLDCNENYFSLTITNFYPPYNINFNSSPVGFTPALFNASYPGPYIQNTVTFGDVTMPTPIGMYDVTITDACGNIKNFIFTVQNRPPVPIVIGRNNGCLTTGNISISIPGYIIATAIVTVAPIDYPFPLPHNITSLLNANGTITLNPVPLGNYFIELANNCNDIIAPIFVNVPDYVDRGFSSTIRNGCDENTSAVKIESLNSKLTSLSIIDAPASFGFSFPYDVTFNIASDGAMYMNNLLPGIYTFTGVDECNYNHTITVNLQGYNITSSNFSLLPNCGSFNIALNFVSNGTTGQSFWLQKLFDPVADTWGNPSTGVIYPNGTVPSATNSIALVNNATNFNFNYNGTFRIVRAFLSFQNGSDINTGVVSGSNKNCIEILAPTLSYGEALEFIDAYRMPCTVSGALDVFIEAIGTGPLRYTIVQENGMPFFLDNGTSNIFYNLPPAIYLFRIEDSCGNIVNRLFDVNTLASIIKVVTPPKDILQCKTVITNNETFDLTPQTALILGPQSASDYTITYHTSLIDAQNGSNAITNVTSFNPTTNPQFIHTRIVLNTLANCYETRSFYLIVGQEPSLNLNTNTLNCTTAPTMLDASVTNLPTTTYLWSNGATTPTVSISAIGVTNLTVTATNTYNGLPCSYSQSITVINSGPPEIESIETSDWTLNENSITVITSGNGTFEYSLDGTTFQDVNYFNHLSPGLYTVYVKDKAGCGIRAKVIWLLYYTKYFTPNGDGYNDYWRIKNSENEPEFKVVIYDRYGKTITSFTSKSSGWDGTYNGNLMVSDDYWFVAYRADGRIHKGHFSMKR